MTETNVNSSNNNNDEQKSNKTFGKEMSEGIPYTQSTTDDRKETRETDHSHLLGEGGNYWKFRYEQLQLDYNQLHRKNQELEDKLLNVVELFEKKREELVANIEFEKSTLMADVDKLSTKLVDARIKLHDYEEKEIIHAAECRAPCHKNCNDPKMSNNYDLNNGLIKNNDSLSASDSQYDPNLV